MKILKFGAIWCTQCLVMKPRFEKIEKELPWLMTEYFELDDEKNEDIVKKYNISNPPVFVFLDKNGKEFIRLEGEVDRKELKELIIKNQDK